MDTKSSDFSSPDAQSDLTTPTMKWFFRLLFSAILFVGLFGNGVVCLAIVLKQRLRTTANLLVLNFSASDFVFLLLYTPTQLSYFEHNYSWEMGDAICKLIHAGLPACLSSTVGTLLCIAFLRYKAAADPFHARFGLTYRTTALVITVIWLLSFLSGLPVLLVAKTAPYKDKTFCDEVWPVGKPYGEIYWVSIFLIQYGIPLLIILFLSIGTVIKVKNSRSRILPTTSTAHNLDTSVPSAFNASVRQRRRQESNTSRVLTCLVILYAICMLPQHVVFFWWRYGDLLKQKYS